MTAVGHALAWAVFLLLVWCLHSERLEVWALAVWGRLPLAGWLAERRPRRYPGDSWRGDPGVRSRR